NHCINYLIFNILCQSTLYVIELRHQKEQDVDHQVNRERLLPVHHIQTHRGTDSKIPQQPEEKIPDDVNDDQCEC
ncbi:MAG TPA: hypothetical protein VJ044_13370, partial [Candidatus Hodarchaeales archaeon]|nr:hypothetical protein [Candidatus Hodarchaeales archaeon]